ncbi:MAG: MBL fold metallo-hydrolase [Actinobacteria bacterium]|nr:MAG: MBL fold metallo-hydrolase [Actinomycetota bacterium]
MGFGYVNAFLVTDSSVTLIDCGVPNRASKLRRAVSESGANRSPADVLVTHHHYDHVGSLASLAPEGVTVWSHHLDSPVIRGESPPPRPASRSALERLGVAIVRRFGPAAPPARVDREVADGEEIPVADGFVAHHTPGHTAGHVSFLYPSKRVLFVGDAAANMFGRLGPPFGLYSEDHAAVRASITKLAALDFDIACFGHGRVLKGSACAKFRKLAEKLA